VGTFKFLIVSCCWSLCYCWCSWCNQWCFWRFCCSFRTCCCWRSCCFLAVGSVPADPGVPILAGGFTYWIVEWDVLYYRTIGLWLSDCNFFLLSNYRNMEYRISEFTKLSDYRITDQGLNLSDYRISDSEKTIGCPPLGIRPRRSGPQLSWLSLQKISKLASSQTIIQGGRGTALSTD
jgi:hypothetical protein